MPLKVILKPLWKELSAEESAGHIFFVIDADIDEILIPQAYKTWGEAALAMKNNKSETTMYIGSLPIT